MKLITFALQALAYTTLGMASDASVSGGVSASHTVADKVVILTEQNFDKLTQADGGMTTGNWFIKFYAPWCGFCKKIAEPWRQLSGELDGEINVAEVDCTTQKKICERFDVGGYPTLKYLAKKKLYDYAGDRELQAMASYARTGYITQESKPIPGNPTIMTIIKKHTSRILREVKGIGSNYKSATAAFVISGAILGALLDRLLCFTCMSSAACCLFSRTDSVMAAQTPVNKNNTNNKQTKVTANPKKED